MEIYYSDNKKKAFKNSFWNLVATATVRLGGFILTIILARFLLAEGYGIFSLVFSIAMIFFNLGDLGVSNTFIRYLSYSLWKEPKKAAAYHFYILKIKFIFSLLSSIILFIIAYPLSFYVFKNSQLFLPMIISAFYIFALSFESFYTQLFFTIEKVHFISLKEIINQILRVGGVLLIFLFINKAYYISGVFLLYLFVSVIMAIICVVFSRKIIPEIYKLTKEEIDKKGVRKFIYYLTIASISSTVFVYVDALLISLFLPVEFLGYYKSAFALVWGIATLIAFPNIVFFPIFTKIDSSKLKELIDKIIKYYFIIIIPSILGLLVLGRYIIKVFYGDGYLMSTLPFYVLSFLIFPIVLFGLFQNLFMAREKPDIFTKLTVAICILNIILNIVLIKLFLIKSPLFAIIGAAIAVEISWFLYFFGSLYYIKKEFHFYISFKSILKPIIAGAIMFIVIYYLLHYVINDMNMIYGGILIMLGILIYFGVLYLIKGINIGEFRFLYNAILKK